MIESPFRARVHERAARAGLHVDAAVEEVLDGYVRLLAKWNGTINLTALSLDPPSDEAIDRLIIEPLAAAHYIQDALRDVPLPVWFDFGSGGGSPAVPLKIVLPGTRLSMIESRSRKAAFLSEVVRALGLSETLVVTSRFEELQGTEGTVDLITVRAVRNDESLAGAASRLLRDHGILALFGPAARNASSLELVRTVQLLPDDETSQLNLSGRVPRGTKPLTAI